MEKRDDVDKKFVYILLCIIIIMGFLIFLFASEKGIISSRNVITGFDMYAPYGKNVIFVRMDSDDFDDHKDPRTG